MAAQLLRNNYLPAANGLLCLPIFSGGVSSTSSFRLSRSLRARLFCSSSHYYNSVDPVSSPRPLDPLRIAFCGSDTFSIHSFLRLLDYAAKSPHHVQSVDLITRRPKPAGRGRKTVKSVPILEVLEHLKEQHQSGKSSIDPDSIPTFTPESKQEFLDLQAHRNYNLVIAVSYGKLIPHQFLSLLPYGGLNVHPSLLPKYSGASPIQSTLLNRDAHAGVTVQTLHPTKFDRGNILLQTGSLSVPKLLTTDTIFDFDKDAYHGDTFHIPMEHSDCKAPASPFKPTTTSILQNSEPLAVLTNVLGIVGSLCLISVLKSRAYELPVSVENNSNNAYSYSPRIPSSASEVKLGSMDIDTILVNNKVLGPIHLWQEVEEKKKKNPETDSHTVKKPVVKRVILNTLSDETLPFTTTNPTLSSQMNVGDWVLVNAENPKGESESRLVFKVKSTENDGFGYIAAKDYKLQGFKNCSAFQLNRSMKKWGIVKTSFQVL